MTTSASLTASIKTVVITEGLPKYNELGLNFYCLLVLSTGIVYWFKAFRGNRAHERLSVESRQPAEIAIKTNTATLVS